MVTKQKRLSIKRARPAGHRFVGVVAAGLALSAGTASADLNPGDTFFNPDVGPATHKFVTGLMPGWFSAFDGSAAAHMIKPLTGDYAGAVSSAVFYLNGVDASDGLGFAYQVHIENLPFGAPGLEEIDFSGGIDRWGNKHISRVGADGSGSSVETGGTYTWDDGDPLLISREGGPGGDGHLGLNFYAADIGGGDNGTYIQGGGVFDTSVFWYEAPDVRSWSSGQINLQNHGQGQGGVLMVPAPGAITLGAIGLGVVGWFRRRRPQGE